MSSDLRRRVDQLRRDIASLRREAVAVSVPVLGNVASAEAWVARYAFLRDRDYGGTYVVADRPPREGDRAGAGPLPPVEPHPLSRPMVMDRKPQPDCVSVPLSRCW